MSESWDARALSPEMMVTAGEEVVEGERADCGNVFFRRLADSARLTAATKEDGRCVGVEGVEGNGDGGAGFDWPEMAVRIPERMAMPMFPQPRKPRVMPGAFFSTNSIAATFFLSCFLNL